MNFGYLLSSIKFFLVFTNIYLIRPILVSRSFSGLSKIKKNFGLIRVLKKLNLGRNNMVMLHSPLNIEYLRNRIVLWIRIVICIIKTEYGLTFMKKCAF